MSFLSFACQIVSFCFSHKMNYLKSTQTNEENGEKVLVCLFQELCRCSRLRASEQDQRGIATSGWLQVHPRCEEQEKKLPT